MIVTNGCECLGTHKARRRVRIVFRDSRHIACPNEHAHKNIRSDVVLERWTELFPPNNPSSHHNLKCAYIYVTVCM